MSFFCEKRLPVEESLSGFDEVEVCIDEVTEPGEEGWGGSGELEEHGEE